MNINKISLWLDTAKLREFPPLSGEEKCDVAIIGAGISGITLAALLQEHGIDTVVLEADRVGSGTTGRTTAKITLQHGLKYTQVAEDFDYDDALLYYKANQIGLDTIADIVKTNKIDCDFKRVASYVYTTNIDEIESIEKEQSTLDKIGIKSTIKDKTELNFDIERAIMMPNQAQFHPLKYLYGIVKHITQKENCRIYENSKVINIEKGNPCIINTTNGKVKADIVVLATNYPTLDMPGFYFTRLHQQRSYIISTRADDIKIEDMYINATEPVNSIRMHHSKEGSHLLLGGYSHKVGQQEEYANGYEELYDFMSTDFSINPTRAYQWSAQDSVTLDGLPYVGNLSKNTKNIYIATGYGKWGMTNSTAAAMIIANKITGNKHPIMEASDLFSPQRFTAKASSGSFFAQSVDTIKEFTLGNLQIQDGSISDVEKGKGKIMRIDGKATAIYRDEQDKIFMFNAHCTHMKCPLTYNEMENSFDCPCHGSRFSMTGEVLEGPATKPLEPYIVN